MSAKPNNSLSANVIVGIGEMADLVRTFPWAESVVGPIKDWSKELLSLVNIILASPLPMFIYWGPESLLIYNDSARSITSIKHPGALGAPAREVWQEAWHIVGPEIKHVLATGESVSHEGILVPLEQDGELTDLYWNYSYSPAFEGTSIAGVFVVCADVTEAVKDPLGAEDNCRSVGQRYERYFRCHLQSGSRMEVYVHQSSLLPSDGTGRRRAGNHGLGELPRDRV